MASISEERIGEIWDRYDRVWTQRPSDRAPIKYYLAADPKEISWNEDTLFSYERLFDYQQSRIQQHYENGLLDDCLPIIYPSYGTGALATSFGSKPFFRDKECPAYSPVVFSAEQAQALGKPDLQKTGCFPKILEITREMEKRLPAKYQLGLFDIQGPLDMAWVIWDPINLVKSMYTNKKAVHEFLSMCTELLIEAIVMQWELVSDPLPFGPVDIYLPMGRGLVISDDVTANLSPPLYKEFGVPYNTRLSEQFGGLIIHSCGNFEHNLENMLNIPGLRGIDYGVTETKTEAMLRVVDRTALHIHGGLYWEKKYSSNIDLVSEQRSKLPENAHVAFSLTQHPNEKNPKPATDEILSSLVL